MPSTTDRNLLFGILALQMDFITREQLIAGMQAWVLAKSDPLAEHLERNGALAAANRRLLEPLVDAHIRQHQNDPAQSLASVSSLGSVRQELARLADRDVEASLACVPQAAAAAPPEPLATLSVALDPNSRGGERFRILRPHAEGGLGRVYVARDQELGREVALKEIKPEKSANPDNRSRFAREAEITGGLEHPGIVPVYGLGTYADGRPYYAMRFIRGHSLKEAIEQFHRAAVPGQPVPSATERNLQLRRLLQRLIDVCEAIDYAHSRGVLHRDLKPGNIMLGRYGETLVVDWGLAKALGKATSTESIRTTTDDTSITQQSPPEPPLVPESEGSSEPTLDGSTIGTPAFMSPEQAEGRLDVIGVASDVFSLGATLYQLLTGQPPYQGDEVLSRARRADFPRPRSLKADISRPLEAICLKAMAAAPGQRYVSARAMAQDLERYLADEQVLACKDRLVDRGARWLRKNRTVAQAATVALVLIALISSGAAFIVQRQKQAIAASERSARKLAEENLQLAKREQSLKTEAEAGRRAAIAASLNEQGQRKRAQKINQFLIDVFSSPTPERDGRTVTVAEVLLKASHEAQVSLQEDPESQGEILVAIGSALMSLDLRKEAQAPLIAGLQVSIGNGAKDPAKSFSALLRLCGLLRDTGQPQLAVDMFEAAIAKLPPLKSGQSSLPRVLFSQLLALAYSNANQPQKAIELLLKTRPELERHFPAEHANMAHFDAMLGRAYLLNREPGRALPLLESALARLQKGKVVDELHSLGMQRELARAHLDMGNPTRSFELYQDLAARHEAARGALHPETLRARADLAAALHSGNKPEEAQSMMIQVLDGYRQRFGPRHVETLSQTLNAAYFYRKSKKFGEARALLTDAIREIVAAPRDRLKFGLLSVMTEQLAAIDMEEGKPDEAAKRYRMILKSLQPNGWTQYRISNDLGAALAAQKLWPEAEELLLSSFAGLKETQAARKDRSKILRTACQRLIDLYTELGKGNEAARWTEELKQLPQPPMATAPPELESEPLTQALESTTTPSQPSN